MKYTIITILLIGIFLASATNGYATDNKDSAYNKITRIIANKLSVRQLKNKQLRQQGLPGNFVVYITDQDLEQANEFPDHVVPLPQKNTREADLEKLWNFKVNESLKGIPEKLQLFSEEQGYDYYLVICAIYNYFRLDENTDFSNISWTNSDLLMSNAHTASGTGKGKVVNKGGYSNLLRHLINNYKDKNPQPDADDKPHIYHFVMTTYVPFENATDAKPIGRLRHFQGISWTSPNNDPAFDEVWKTFFSTRQAELAGKNNTEQKKATKEEWLAGFVTANQTMLAAIRKTHPEELAAITDKTTLTQKLKELPEAVYAGFSAALRIQMLRILSQDAMTNDAEKIACGLVEQAPVVQADSVINAMREANPKIPEKVFSSTDPRNSTGSLVNNYQVGWCLLRCLTEFTDDNTMGVGGGDNYHRLIKGLTALCYKSDGFKQKAEALNDAYLDANEGKIPDRVIFYTYNSFWSKISSTFLNPQLVFEPKLDLSTSYDGNCGLQTEKELFLSYAMPNISFQKLQLDPFEPIVFENQTDLGLLADIDEIPASGPIPQPTDRIVPAIILKYADDKASKETITDATMAAIDVASLATGYGELKAGIKGIRKSWVIFDMINSGVNIVGNVAAYDKPTLKALMQYYNLATGAVALGRMASGAVKNVKGIYNVLKAEKTAMNATSIRTFLSSIKSTGEDLVELHPDDAERILKYLERLKAEAKAKNLNTFEKSVDEAITTVKAGGKIVSDAIASNKIFKKLVSLSGVSIENGTSLIVSKTKALIAHWTKGGTTMYLDAAENISSDGKLIDIIEGESYVARGGSTVVTEDVMIMQGADGTVYCVRGACFVAGTPVHTQGGIKPIEQVQESEEVLSLDVQSGQKVYEKVIKTFQRTASRLVRLVAGKDTLLSTPEHPYYTDSGWKMASAIHPGSKMRLASGLFAVALSTATIDTTATVYNFEVNRTHNYCIGSQGIVVHNSCQILNRLRKLIDPELLDDFVKDFSADANMLSKFDRGEYSIDAWQSLHSRAGFRISPDVLLNVTQALKSRSLQNLGINRAMIDRICRALLNDYKTYGNTVKALDNEMFTTLNNFGKFMDHNPETEFINFEKIISDLTSSGFPNRKGSHWVLKDIASDAGTFGGKRASFNVRQRVDDVDYYVDVAVQERSATEINGQTRFLEYKSGPNTIIKKEEFLREFVKRDLFNTNVRKPNQLSWRRDVVEDGLRKRIVDWLDSDETRELLNGASRDVRNKIIQMFDDLGAEVGYEKSIRNTDDLITFFKDNKDWFNLIFK
jgi:hypothetical protein